MIIADMVIWVHTLMTISEPIDILLGYIMWYRTSPIFIEHHTNMALLVKTLGAPGLSHAGDDDLNGLIVVFITLNILNHQLIFAYIIYV